MRIKALLIDKTTTEVFAHRVLKQKFPQLKLYVHYAINSKGGIDNENYSISDENGIGITPYFDSNIKNLIEEVERIINFYGIDTVLKKQKDMTKTIATINNA